MLLRDNLITELRVLAAIRPSFQKVVLTRHQDWLITKTPESFMAYIEAAVELAQREAVIEFISRTLDESDDA